MHLEGEFVKYITGDRTMIHHGSSIQQRGARVGATIILSNNPTEGWKKGGHAIERGGKTMGGTTRLIRIPKLLGKPL